MRSAMRNTQPVHGLRRLGAAAFARCASAEIIACGELQNRTRRQFNQPHPSYDIGARYGCSPVQSKGCGLFSLAVRNPGSTSTDLMKPFSGSRRSRKASHADTAGKAAFRR